MNRLGTIWSKVESEPEPGLEQNHRKLRSEDLFPGGRKLSVQPYGEEYHLMKTCEALNSSYFEVKKTRIRITQGKNKTNNETKRVSYWQMLNCFISFSEIEKT